ncbi:hypothetical protein [Staphylococcus argenteus]|uniref:hypothetical protein n=1 Tax=Staphylococcus argenteus TaxID=985002 RepID=UPI000F82E345|nr:hypothetical protein [Staphylococcus argenteus]
MNYIYYFLVVVVFTLVWSVIVARFLPLVIVNIPAKKVKKDSVYDERQTTIITEILARTFVMTSFGVILNLILKITNLDLSQMAIFNKYPELMYIILGVFFFIFNLFLVNKKYTVRGK